MNWLGLDIGGANIKAADAREYAQSTPFALWKEPRNLAAMLQRVMQAAPEQDALAVTMTGELADCFTTKAEGVDHILRAVREAAPDSPMKIYGIQRGWLSWAEALDDPWQVAAGNWHALARFAARYADPALLIDIGSTTTDIIPIESGQPSTEGQHDTARLLAGELVYTGVARSPLCAVVSTVPWRGQTCPVAQEFFATMRDVYLTLETLPEDEQDRNTADGRPATIVAARDRLARSICADRSIFSNEDAVSMAHAARDAQIAQLRRSIQQVYQNRNFPAAVIASGEGAFLVPSVLTVLDWSPQVISLKDQLGPTISRCATAYALAVLAEEAKDH